MRLRILKSINNIYTALSPVGGEYTLRIKGKKLRGVDDEYNPVVVGDWVEAVPYSDTEGLITAVEERKSSFVRYNFKSGCNQTISSNQDITCIVFSALSPPFRPRFVDRAITCTFNSDIILVLNKIDYGLTEDEKERYELYRSLGYSCIAVSSVSGQGIEKLKDMIRGRTACFVGQSGVGKSTLINTILGSSLRTGDLCSKYNRGRHTTNHSVFLSRGEFTIIDTPGVREIQVPIEDEIGIRNSFPEFRACNCQYPDCLHNGETGCRVPGLLEEGKIHPDRYLSYLKTLESVSLLRPKYGRGGRK